MKFILSLMKDGCIGLVIENNYWNFNSLNFMVSVLMKVRVRLESFIDLYYLKDFQQKCILLGLPKIDNFTADVL